MEWNGEAVEAVQVGWSAGSVLVTLVSHFCSPQPEGIFRPKISERDRLRFLAFVRNPILVFSVEDELRVQPQDGLPFNYYLVRTTVPRGKTPPGGSYFCTMWVEPLP